MSRSSITTGTDTVLTLGDANFTNKAPNRKGDSVVQLTDNKGNITELEATYVTDYNIETFIPGAMAPGSYRVVAMKQGRENNPVNLTIKAKASIDSAVCHDKIPSLTGSGLGGYSNAVNSDTTVTMGTETGRVSSWSDTEIHAEVSGCDAGAVVSVTTIFGTNSATVQ